MVVSSLDRKLLRDFWRIRGQALAIALVIACGVATVVMAFGTYQSLDETRQIYYERYRFADVFASLKRAPDHVAQKIAEIPGVSRVETRIVEYVTLDIEGMDEPATGQLLSIPETGQPDLNKLVIRAGRWIDPDDPDEVLVNENFADAHAFKEGDRFSAIINGRKRKLEIAGIALSPEFIYSAGPAQILPDDRTFGVIWIGRQALESTFDLKGAFNSVSVSVLRNASKDAIADRIDHILDLYGGINAHDRSEQYSHVFITNELLQLENMGKIIPPIFLAVAAFLLHIVISRLIDTERELIGLFKAFGYGNMEVAWHYLKLVLILTAFGTTLGVLLGNWMGRGMTSMYTQFFRFPFLYYESDKASIALAVLIAFGATIAGTYSAVKKAIALEPAVAMRPAPPLTYRKGLLEKLGLFQKMDEPSRMILRHIRRWPLRATLTIIGMSLSVALLILSLFPLDAFEHMINVHYFKAQRQDATISFVEARNMSSQRLVTTMPGVLAAEHFRNVPVKISFAHRTEQVGLVGVLPGAKIAQLLDVNLNPIIVPPKGVTLSKHLAKELHVGLGDLVSVKSMTGKRITQEIPVTAIVQEYIGMSAYMDIAALASFMQEPQLASGYYVTMDDAAALDLFKEVKNIPIVAGVALKGTVIRSFREILEENINIAISFYLLFGGLIAFGVVYNTARIALSERARELASLRVLGFTQGEVSYILLGEIALLTLASLPVGCLFGYGLAWFLAGQLETEIFRLPVIVNNSTLATSMFVVVLSSVVSCIIVGRRISKLDLVAVLKTRD